MFSIKTNNTRKDITPVAEPEKVPVYVDPLEVQKLVKKVRETFAELQRLTQECADKNITVRLKSKKKHLIGGYGGLHEEFLYTRDMTDYEPEISSSFTYKFEDKL